MKFCSLTLTVVLLLISFFAVPALAENLWNIYELNEEVIMLLETENSLDIEKFSNFKKQLLRVLPLKQDFYLDPMFPDAPTIDKLSDIYGFKPKFDLRNFYTLIISSSEEILRSFNSPFNLADYLWEVSLKWNELKMRTVEPDLPLSAYLQASANSSSNCPDKKNSPKDRAWHLRNMNIPKAWNFSKEEGYAIKGSGEKIGHPDTGYSDHIDLDDNALEKDKENNFIEKGRLPIDPLPPKTILTQPGHGTSTGSVIISRGDVTESSPTTSEGGTTGRGKVTGVACEADLIPYRAIVSVVRFTYGNIVKAIYKAVNDGCSVISLSLGGTGHSALNASMEYAIGNNVIIVAAAGNRPARKVVYPARYPFCIAIAATNFSDKPWDGSARGNEVTVSAPGEAVWRALRTQPSENIEIVEPSCGTSYSTANVAGIAALWLAHYKRSDLIDQFNGDTKLQFVFKRLLKETARRPQEWNYLKFGSGIVDADKLLKTDPNKVRKQAKDDYKEFTEQKRESANSNLNAIAEMHYAIWGSMH
jgi:hypothetical protein